MNFSLKESSQNEIFRIISINIDKIRMLLTEPNYNFSEMKQFLCEFEYDLKLIYDILKQQEMKGDDYLKLSEKIRKHFLHLNNNEENKKKFNNKGRNKNNKNNKKYSLTINILSDKYFDTYNKNNKKFSKSNSCKSYRNKLSKNIIKNLKKNIKINSFRNNREKNDINDNEIMSYLTDYSYKKRYDSGNSYNIFRSNIHKNRISLNHLNTLYNHYDELLKKNNHYIKYANTDYEYKKDINLDNSPSYRTYSIISSEENKNNNNMNFNYQYINDYKKHNNYMKDRMYKKYINEESTKKMIKKIIPQILDDSIILKNLKKNYGNDIGQRLIEGELESEEINDIANFLKKNDKNKNDKEKNLFRGSKYLYRNYKYDNNNYNNKDILLLRNFKHENKFNNLYNSDYYNNIPLSDE